MQSRNMNTESQNGQMGSNNDGPQDRGTTDQKPEAGERARDHETTGPLTTRPQRTEASGQKTEVEQKLNGGGITGETARGPEGEDARDTRSAFDRAAAFARAMDMAQKGRMGPRSRERGYLATDSTEDPGQAAIALGVLGDCSRNFEVLFSDGRGQGDQWDK